MKYARIDDNDVCNGLGITMTLWTQGCPHRCLGCHNESTWDFNSGNEFNSKNLDYIINNINNNNINRNLSILGGEPLCSQNIEGVLDLCKKFKEAYPQKTIYLWTGYTFEELKNNKLFNDLLNYIDILIDGRFEINKRNLSLRLKGSENQRVIDVQQTLINKEIIIKEIK